MWMNPYSGKYHSRMCLCQVNGGEAGGKITARINHAGNATLYSGLNNMFTVSIEAGGINMRMTIDEQRSNPFPDKKREAWRKYALPCPFYHCL